MFVRLMFQWNYFWNLQIVSYTTGILSANFRNWTMFRNGKTCAVRNNITFYRVTCLSKLSIVMASSKETLTSTKTSSLPHFLFWRLKCFYWEAIIRSYIFLLSILTFEFIVSSTTLGCVFGNVSIMKHSIFALANLPWCFM